MKDKKLQPQLKGRTLEMTETAVKPYCAKNRGEMHPGPPVWFSLPFPVPVQVLRQPGQFRAPPPESRRTAKPGHPEEPHRLRQRPRAHAEGRGERPARIHGPLHRAPRKHARFGRSVQGERRRGCRAEIEVSGCIWYWRCMIGARCSNVSISNRGLRWITTISPSWKAPPTQPCSPGT